MKLDGLDIICIGMVVGGSLALLLFFGSLLSVVGWGIFWDAVWVDFWADFWLFLKIASPLIVIILIVVVIKEVLNG